MTTDPSTTALTDQVTMHARAELSKLAQDLATGDAIYGAGQNTANFVAYLAAKRPPAYLAALVITAARRIRELEQEARS